MNLEEEHSLEESFWRDRWWSIESMFSFPRNSQAIFTNSFSGLFNIGISTFDECAKRELKRKERDLSSDRISEVLRGIMELSIIGYVAYRSYYGDAKDAIPAYFMGKMFYRGILDLFRSIVHQTKVKGEVEVITEVTNLVYDEMDADEEKEELVVTKNSKITFENFCFGFPSKKKLHFENINFEITLGASYALIGINGEGKTTLINFLIGRLFSTSGNILIDGVPTSRIKKAVLANFFSVYSPDFMIMDCLSAREFIDPERRLTDEQCWKIFQDVHLNKKLEEYGLETIIGAGYPKGTGFSTGEEQKLLIARLLAQLVMKKTFVIGDEITANIAEYEQEYFINLIKSYSLGCIFITHTQKVVAGCDRIIACVDRKLYNNEEFEKLESDTKNKILQLIKTSKE